jgi:hypothetical protein
MKNSTRALIIGSIAAAAVFAAALPAFANTCYGNCSYEAPSCSIWASNVVVPFGGSTTLSWTTTSNASSANLETVGAVSLSGSHTLYNLTETRSYKLNVYGQGGGSSGNCQVTIQVTGGPQAYPTNPPLYGSGPACTISISSAPNYGSNTALLTWSSSNATVASISPELGLVPTSGSRVVNIMGQTYSMSVYGAGGKTSVCQTSSYAPMYPFGFGSAYAYNFPVQPGYPYQATVKLSQIPYTGADFGLVGNLAAWLSVMLLAGAGAVTIARRNGFAEKITTLIAR